MSTPGEGKRISRCDLVAQYEAYKVEILQAIERVLASGRYTLAEEVARFEAEFAAYVGCPYAVGVNSGTDALIMALSGLDLREGDEVVTTPFTAIPTYSAIRHAGAEPVFVDIDRRTFLMDMGQLGKALTPRTKAVMPVHIFGNAVDVEQMRAIVGPGIRIIEDCAQSHGATVRGKMTGSLGDISAFSFYPTKNLGGYGDGGIVLTSDEKLASDFRLRRTYGMVNKDQFVRDGVNTRLDELQAAILRVKLRHLGATNARRRELAALYAQRLADLPVHPQQPGDGAEPVWHVYSAYCDSRRDELVAYLETQDIQTNVYYPMPLSQQEGYVRVYGQGPELPVVEDVCRHVIALPFYPEMAEETVETVVQAIAGFYS